MPDKKTPSSTLMIGAEKDVPESTHSRKTTFVMNIKFSVVKGLKPKAHGTATVLRKTTSLGC